MKHSINLHIDELVLHGFAPSERKRIGAAVQRELERLIGEQEMAQKLQASVSMASLRPVTVHVGSGTAAATGAGIGQAIFRNLAQLPVARRGISSL